MNGPAPLRAYEPLLKVCDRQTGNNEQQNSMPLPRFTNLAVCRLGIGNRGRCVLLLDGIEPVIDLVECQKQKSPRTSIMNLQGFHTSQCDIWI